jgi:signal transduction histidine kinase
MTAFAVFSLGYLSLVLAFLRISKLVSRRLSHEIAAWSDRLRENPKNVAPLLFPPFAELLPLKKAIEGLNEKIENYEKTASNTAQLLILRGIAHDLLTPVARLQLYVATLSAGIDRDQNAEVLADIQDSLNRVVGIASQVKALKEIEGTEVTINLVSSTAEEVRNLRDSPEIVTKFISLEFLATCESIAAPFSQIEISRIVSNLVKNAAESSTKGSTIKVEIGTDNGFAFLSVMDFGCGISAKSIGRVFDPDFTLKPGTGTGLGLSIVKYICDQRSAKIHLKSEARQGTTVTIRVPEQRGNNHV